MAGDFAGFVVRLARTCGSFAKVSIATLAFVMSAGIAVANCEEFYTVKEGDTLPKIAKAQLGSMFDYAKLQQANFGTLGGSFEVRAGMVLDVPCPEVAPGEARLNLSVMPDPETVAPLIKVGAVQVLDVRTAEETGGGVLPETILIPFETFRGPADNPGLPPSEERLAEIFGNAGLHLDRPIVIVHHKPTQMDTGRAAFVYWLLKSSGAEQLAIMRGGFNAWQAIDLPVSETAAKAEPYTAQVSFARTWRADALDVYGVATKQTNGYLLDARPHSVVQRIDDLGRRVRTTLPGAQNVPVQPLMSRLKGEIDMVSGAAAVVDYMHSNDIDWRSGKVISFCNAGELSALNWFYASEIAGLDNFVLFPESVAGWSSDGGNLVAIGSEG